MVRKIWFIDYCTCLETKIFIVYKNWDWTWDNKAYDRFQSSLGEFNQSYNTWGTTAWGAEDTASLWHSKVVVLLDNASASSADGVEMRGKCLTSTDAPRNAAIMCKARRNMDADVSWGTLLLGHPWTKASLSVRRSTSLPIRSDGQHRKGRMDEAYSFQSWGFTSVGVIRRVTSF